MCDVSEINAMKVGALHDWSWVGDMNVGSKWNTMKNENGSQSINPKNHLKM